MMKMRLDPIQPNNMISGSADIEFDTVPKTNPNFVSPIEEDLPILRKSIDLPKPLSTYQNRLPRKGKMTSPKEL